MKSERLQSRLNRKRRIRKKVFGTAETPRLTIYRTSKHIYAQVINDVDGTTLTASSTIEKMLRKKKQKTGGCEAAKIIGESIGEKALQKGLKKVVFDRNGFAYHGRVKALADGAREKGLKF